MPFNATSDEHDFVTTEKPLVLLSVNDGEASMWPPFNSPDAIQDSITVVHTFPDAPPIIQTVSENVWGTVAGSPRVTIIGRYGIVTNHAYRPWAPDSPVSITGPNRITVIDLESEGLATVEEIELTSQPRLALAHPDGNRVVVAAADRWLVFALNHETGSLRKIKESEVLGTVYSFDIGSDGKTIIATMSRKATPPASNNTNYCFKALSQSMIQ